MLRIIHKHFFHQAPTKRLPWYQAAGISLLAWNTKNIILLYFLGNCVCGECKCNPGYTGKYCQNEKDQKICQKLEPCILSKFFSEDYAQDCFDNTHFGDSKIPLFGKKISKACFGNLTYTGLYSKVVIIRPISNSFLVGNI